MEKLYKALDVPSSIADIVNAAETPAGSLFYKYKDKSQIGLQIFKELMSRFVVEKRGFVMYDSTKNIGLLSQCQSLQSLLLLTSSFDLTFDDVYEGTKHIKNENGDKVPLTIRMVMDIVIDDIIRRLTKLEDEEMDKVKISSLVFDSSPFLSEAFDEEYAYIDCITWVIPTFLLVLKYHVSINEICRYERQLIDIIKIGLDYISEAYIPIDALRNNEKLTCGWNFTKDCEEPSL